MNLFFSIKLNHSPVNTNLQIASVNVSSIISPISYNTVPAVNTNSSLNIQASFININSVSSTIENVVSNTSLNTTNLDKEIKVTDNMPIRDTDSNEIYQSANKALDIDSEKTVNNKNSNLLTPAVLNHENVNPSKRLKQDLDSSTYSISANRFQNEQDICQQVLGDKNRRSDLLEKISDTEIVSSSHSFKSVSINNKLAINSTFSKNKFNWPEYIGKNSFLVAPVHYFKHVPLHELFRNINTETQLYVEVPNNKTTYVQMISENVQSFFSCKISYWFAMVVKTGWFTPK
jgi:hypothetical protein